MKRILFLCLLPVIAFAASTKSIEPKPLSAKAKKNVEAYEAELLKLAPPTDSLSRALPPSTPMTKDERAAVEKQEERRRVASSGKAQLDASYFEGKMSPQYKQFRTEFLAIKTAEELDEKLTALDAAYDKLPEEATDLKFIAAQVIPFRAFRGLVWRLIPIVNTSKVTHSAILTQVKNIAVNTKLFFPTDQWQAGVDYVTQPFVQNGIWPFLEKGQMIQQFSAKKNLVEVPLQAYFSQYIIPAMEKAAERIDQLKMSQGVYVWDNKFLYSTGKFNDAQDRYLLLGEVERLTALSTLYAGLSEAYYQSAFSWNGSMELASKIGSLYGFDAAFFSEIDGVPAQKRAMEIRGTHGWGLRFIQEDYGIKRTKKALEYLTKAVDKGSDAWTLLQKRPASSVNFIDSAYLLPFQRTIDLRFDNLKFMLQGKKEVRSVITGDSVVVNLPEWYNNPPMDLKRLYGWGFEQGPEFIKNAKVMTKAAGEVTLPPYRNYLHGRAIVWDKKEFKKIFPELQSDEQLIRFNRILAESWGGGWIASPLSMYMN